MKSKITLLITALSLTVLISACTGKSENIHKAVKYVKVEKVQSDHKNDVLTFNGSIKEQSLTSLSFRVGGPLVKLNFKSGDFVPKGAVIASIDKRDYELQLSSTETQYNQLKGEYERYKELYEKGKIPANTYEKIESGYLMAKTSYDNAQNQLFDTDLKAPFDGYIHEKFIENYMTVGPGIPVVSIIDLSNLEVVISVPENQLKKVRKSTNNYLSVSNAGVNNLPLEVKSIGEKAGSDGLYEMKLYFKNEASLDISPGMSAEVKMICKERNAGIKIPVSAILHEGSVDYIWIYNDETGSIHKQEIKLGKLIAGKQIEVISGLSDGDMLVTAGVYYLYEGQKVKPVKPASESNVGGLL